MSSSREKLYEMETETEGEAEEKHELRKKCQKGSCSESGRKKMKMV